MTSSSEVIALEGAGDRRGPGPGSFRFRTNFRPKKPLKHLPYFVDPSIVPRVKQYLEDNRDKVYVDIDEMVTELQRKYRDYSKKKRSAFKGLVEKAFSVVLKTYNLNDDTMRDGEESDSSNASDMEIDSEDVDLIVEHNSGNNQVMKMYLQQQAMKKLAAAKAGSITDGGKELIDLSSDDDQEEIPPKRIKHADSINVNDPKPNSLPPKAANGQATPEEVSVPDEIGAPEEVGIPQEHVTTSSSAAAGAAAVLPPASQVPTTPLVGSERPKRKRNAADNSSSQSASVNGEMPKRKRREVSVLNPCCSFKDIGGCSAVLQEVCKLLVHIRHPEIFEQIGVSPPRGFLLHGPPGCGKSLLASAIAGELGVPLLKVAAPELVAGVSGESEERIRDLFDQAASLAPCVLFLDEIDAITPNRNNAQREMERRIVAQLLTTLDELGEKEGGNQVLVIGATNRPDSLDPALRRAGRFDREVCMGIPDREARAHILRVVCGRLALSPEVSTDAGIEELASLTPGYVGADLTALTREAAMVAVNRIFNKLQEDKKAEEANQPEQELKEYTVKECNEVQEVPTESCESESSAIQAVEVVQADNQQTTKSSGEDQTSTEAQGTCEVVNLEDGVSSSIIAPAVAENISAEGKEEIETMQSAPIEEQKNDKQEIEEISEVTDKQEIEEISEVTDKQEIEEISVVTDKKDDIEEISEVTENKDKESNPSSSKEECPLSLHQDVEILPQHHNVQNETDADAEVSVCAKTKTDDDVEVLEVQTVNNAENSAALVHEVPEKSSDPAPEEVKVKDLVLSQKLNPLSVWSPELCQLMSWLKDTPPLSTTQLSNLTITMADFHEALHHVQPSSKREGFVTVPDVTWEDIGSLANVRVELQLCILAPVRYAAQFKQLGLQAPSGVLLCGPPGCGKTLLAKAVANEAGINFISVKGPELLNMYVGESERAVRQVFQRARNSSPCVIFFDELDALCPKRSDSGDNGVSSRVVNQLLTEMDGIEGRAAVFLMAASNRPDIIDPAVLRPGRVDKIVYVGLPNAEDRKDILRALTKNGTRPQLAPDVDLSVLANLPKVEGYSGADMAALVREAGVQALREYIGAGEDMKSASLCVALRHFKSAAAKIRPSVSLKERKHYDKLREMYSSESSGEKSEAMDTT